MFTWTVAGVPIVANPVSFGNGPAGAVPHWKDTLTDEAPPRLVSVALTVTEVVPMFEAAPVVTAGAVPGGVGVGVGVVVRGA